MDKKKYDVIVVGMGPSSAFFAYESIKLNSKKKILLIDQGKRVENRNCPIEKTGKCVKCKPFCSITNGFSGAGAFSDGKLSLYNEEDEDFYVGGNLHKYLGVEETKRLIDYTDKIYLDFGGDKHLEGIEYKEEVDKIRKKAKKQGIELISIPIRHLGTEKAHSLYQKIEEYIEKSGIEMMFDTIVTDVIIENNEVKGVKIKPSNCVDDENSKIEEIYSDKVIVACRKKRRKLAFRYVSKS